jgi:hypothetical protein
LVTEDLLQFLRPQTLACLVVDTEETLEEWQTYPENAPAPPVQEALRQLGVAAADRLRWQTEGSFEEILEQVRDQYDQDDWLTWRNEQDRDNWLADYQ